ncbi:MAG: D-3-phosphoglycerate dehydrogenase [Gammaproteobacteria bacterium]|jgi:D-3-phosphoglycerate dehydrogenase
MFKVLKLNNIAVAGLERLPRDEFEVASDLPRADAILLRSFNMHDYEIPSTLKAIGRAGAGVNNIPLSSMSERGIVVFNAPGANANAVKELVLTGMLLAARNVCAAWDFVRGLDGDDAQLSKQVEAGKKQFVGFELPGRTLGVVGLGAIGVQVANVALSLGMRVIGYDPEITVRRAWQLSANVSQAASVGDLLAQSDFVTLHVPLVDATRGLLDERRIELMRDGSTLLNFSRDGIADEQALRVALDAGKLNAYVCDFPTKLLKGHPRTIALPHIGASTKEAEDNCARMVADQIKDYLQDGNISNSVNFPEIQMPRSEGYRLAVVNANVPNMLGQISTALANGGLNIIDMLNKSRGNLAYTLCDVDAQVTTEVISALVAIKGVLSVRML